MKNIATILTVYNRREKTLRCLRHLFAALDAHNANVGAGPVSTRNEEAISLSVFLTDDGCTDGTAEAVTTEFADRDIHIVKGTGSLFWAGGMRLAWREALGSTSEAPLSPPEGKASLSSPEGKAPLSPPEGGTIPPTSEGNSIEAPSGAVGGASGAVGGASGASPWDYFLLLNDDTYIYNNVFAQLFEADEYGFSQTGRHGIVSGITCQPGKPDMTTYGGMNFVGKTKGKHIVVEPSGTPQRIDMPHANILLIHSSVVGRIGIFYDGYQHANADQDYGMLAQRSRIPVLVTSRVCGECEYNHLSKKDEMSKLCNMTLAERKRYVKSPPHSDIDYLIFVRRNLPLRYPMAVLVRKIRVYFPSVYKYILGFRGLYKKN